MAKIFEPKKHNFLSDEKLNEIVERAARKILSQQENSYISNITGRAEQRLMSFRELCSRWEISTRELNNMMKRGFITPMRFHCRMLFPMSDILNLEDLGIIEMIQEGSFFEMKKKLE